MHHIAGKSADNGIEALLGQGFGSERCRFVVNTDNDIVVEGCDSVDRQQVVRKISRSKNNGTRSKPSIISRSLLM